MNFSEIMYKGFLGYFLENHVFQSGFLFFSIIVLGMLCIVFVPYLLGSLNFAIIISKYFYHDDVRLYGSGNAGMTNMLRTYGKKAGALTLATDAGKAVVAVLFGRLIFGILGAYIAGVSCVLGHVFPVFYKFKGGKGVVVSAVTILMTNWHVGIVLVLFFVILVASTKFISLGSVMCALIYPLLLSRMNRTDPQLAILFAFILTVVVVVKHRSNIKRLIEGTENKLSFSKKEKNPSEQEQKPQ